MTTDCIIHTGSVNVDGYGKVMRSGQFLAHRAAWVEQVGEIPVGMEIDHLCSVRACVNINHLEPVTPTENKRRARHDHGGHDTFVDKSGRFRCRTCATRYARNYNAQAAMTPDMPGHSAIRLRYVSDRIVVEQDCWIWTLTPDKYGYGLANDPITKRQRMAHRMVYDTIVGNIPHGATFRRFCRKRNCVNPDHMKIAYQAIIPEWSSE